MILARVKVQLKHQKAWLQQGTYVYRQEVLRLRKSLKLISSYFAWAQKRLVAHIHPTYATRHQGDYLAWKFASRKKNICRTTWEHTVVLELSLDIIIPPNLHALFNFNPEPAMCWGTRVIFAEAEIHKHQPADLKSVWTHMIVSSNKLNSLLRDVLDVVHASTSIAMKFMRSVACDFSWSKTGASFRLAYKRGWCRSPEC